MLQCVQATIAEDGTVCLLELAHVNGVQRAILTILDERLDEPAYSGKSGGGNSRVVRETAGLWRGKYGDAMEYVGKLRSEWDFA